MIFILKRPASLVGPSGFSKLLSSLENNLESQKFLFLFLFHFKILFLQKWTGSLGMRRFLREGLPIFDLPRPTGLGDLKFERPSIWNLVQYVKHLKKIYSVC
jgi:hypothetical protein